MLDVSRWRSRWAAGRRVGIRSRIAVSLSPSLASTSFPAACWRLTAGSVVAVLGAALLAVEWAERQRPALPHGSPPPIVVASEATTIEAPPAGPTPNGLIRAWERNGRAREETAPSGVISGELPQAPRIDRRAAALFGPPDHQPEAAWLSEVVRSERGTARAYLVGTAMARWLATGFRAVLAWEATSGYGAVEASRADDRARLLAMRPSLGCTPGAEYQETPSCSAAVASLD
jgi:hypothetical protein